MLFQYSILYVPDVAKSLAFYEAAFGFKTRFLHESGGFGELDTGATTLAFCSLELLHTLGKTPGRPDPQRPSCEIAFTTSDVAHALAQALGAGARLLQPAEDMAWGQTTAYVADPDGFVIELCTPMAG